MKIYQELCKRHPTFRERSETVDLAVEISLQPWEAFQPDGVILFSDILTPLQGEDRKEDDVSIYIYTLTPDYKKEKKRKEMKNKSSASEKKHKQTHYGY